MTHHLLPETTFSISFVIYNIYIGLNNGYIIVRWLADSMYKNTTLIDIVSTSYLTLAVMPVHIYSPVLIVSSLIQSEIVPFCGVI